MAKRKAAKKKTTVKRATRKKIAKKTPTKKTAAKKTPAKKSAPARIATVTMTLTNFQIDPAAYTMQEETISFSHVASISGNSSPDNFTAEFTINSANWILMSAASKSFPVNSVGTHTFPDELVFALAPGKTRTSGDVFTVNVKGYLASNVDNYFPPTLTVTVE
jgi:hypothetical protein